MKWQQNYQEQQRENFKELNYKTFLYEQKAFPFLGWRINLKSKINGHDTWWQVYLGKGSLAYPTYSDIRKIVLNFEFLNSPNLIVCLLSSNKFRQKIVLQLQMNTVYF